MTGPLPTRLADRRALLSTAWVFVLLNVLFRDVHEMLRPGFLAEVMADGNPNIEAVLLVAAVVIEVPIAMVLANRLLPRRAARWGNLLGAVAVALGTATFALGDLDDMFFAAAITVGLAFIVWATWTWPASEAPAAEAGRLHRV